MTGKAILFAVGEDRVLCLRLHWFQEREGQLNWLLVWIESIVVNSKFWDEMILREILMGWIVLFNAFHVKDVKSLLKHKLTWLWVKTL